MTLDRRDLLRAGLLAGGALALPAGVAAPAFARARPAITHGVQAGEVTGGGALVWTRADRPSRMLVDYGTRPDFRGHRTVRGPWLSPGTDLTGKVALRGLPDGRRIHYRVRLDDGRVTSAPETGSFATAPRRGQDVRFVWGGDLAGQGWGINEDFGGYRIFNAMADVNPDFFLCSGDWVYADGPLAETVALPDGTVWKNVLIDEKAKVAETLAEYRGQFRYNLMDANLRAFNARVPIVYQWDDHEVTNNWYPGEILDDARYTEKNVDVLTARARRAIDEYLPIDLDKPLYRKVSYGPLLDVFVLDMRSYKNKNTPNLETDGRGLLGAEQKRWLTRELRRSKATWKVIANDLPVGLIVPDGTAQEGVGNTDSGLPLGREREIAEVLRDAYRNDVTGIVFLTADVHYTAAHYYDPAKASFKDFAPFWEFVAGPLNAGTFGPNTLDGTFGPTQEFFKAGPRANASPAEGAQFFGEVEIDSRSKAFTVRLRDLDNKVLYTKTLTA
ncbi:alkaline phosphatase D family protein [Actinocorallia populi]|uniref:alkaline phosphatase D family protein n=1 Tax=Actinocorallia populi TaxID=2079200 RepID=UPI000D0973F7|nr:alkaline phosphatase D family protein [Actinocorallia populi]